MRSGVFQAPERSEAGEGRLARGQDGGRVHSLRPLVTESPRGAPRRQDVGSGPRGSLGRALPFLAFLSPQLCSFFSAFVLRVLVVSELRECTFPHTDLLG